MASQDDFPSLSQLSNTSPIVPSSSNGKLSAAQMLQRVHATSSTDSSPAVNGHAENYLVDPFPPSLLQVEEASESSVNGTKKAMDISDESAFPSLGGSGKKVGSGPTWGSGVGSVTDRVRQQASIHASSVPSSRSATPSSFDDKPSNNSIYTTTVQLPTLAIHVRPLTTGSGGKPFIRGSAPSKQEPEPTTLGEVMKLLMKKSPSVKVEASASTSRQVTTFIIKAKGIHAEAEVEKVKRELLARLSKKVEIQVQIPAGLRAFIIGAKGKTLKDITDSTGATVQVPNREEVDAAASPSVNSIESPDGPLISITISGESSGVALARSKILSIVSERASKVTSKVDVPQQFWPHLNVEGLLSELELVDLVSVVVPRTDEVRGILSSVGEEKIGEEKEEKKVIVKGDGENVRKVVGAIQAQVEELKRVTKTITVSIAKRQHRCLVGKHADHVFASTGCSVELPDVEGADENVTIRGPQSELVKALGLVMEVSNSEPIETLDLLTAHRGNHDTKAYSSHLTRYLLRKSKFQALSTQHSVQVYLPRASAIEAGTPLIEIVGQDAVGLAGARKDVISIVRALPPANFWTVNVDALNHRHLYSGKNGKKIKALEEEKIEVLFPAEGSDRSDILLVYSGEGAATQALASAIAEINELAKEAATIKTTTLTIPNKLHKHIQGQNGTTLNAILGEEKLSSASFGAKGDDKVIVRGPEKDLARVVKEIERIAEEAKDNEVANSHVIEFEVDTLQVRHVVGKAGSGINKLREELGVQVDFEELPVASTSAGKKAGVARSKVTIKGRKENCQAAKKRITTVVDKMADEVTLTIPLSASVERGSIIGKQGTYLIRLETTYDVRINFPKAGKKADEAPEKNEIVIRGGKKGAEAAKKELVDLMEYEKENGNVVSFTVVRAALPRILGKAGATINGIKEEAGVNSIDVDQSEEEGAPATITLKGTRTGTAKAKALILAISKEVEDEAKLTMEIPRAFHTTLIGSGGASIRDLIARAGGPTDARGSGNAVRFPKQGDSLNTVTIVATKSVAEKIRKALEKEVAALESRITWGVVIPQAAHAGIIGKGASALQELQRKHGVKVVVPGWNDYASAGEVVNPTDVANAQETDIVKVLGPREAAIACAEEMSKNNRQKSADSGVTATVQVPRKCHAKIAQGGRFFRSLPNGTKITHDGVKPPSNASKLKRPSTPAAEVPTSRIDDDESAGNGEAGEKVIFQLVALNVGSAEEDDAEIPWVITANNQADLDKTVAEIEKALSTAVTASHCGWVTISPGFMPRIVGRGGAGLDKLRSAGVEVEVVGRRDSNELTLIGTPESIDVAHKMILALAAPRPPRAQRDRDDY